MRLLRGLFFGVLGFVVGFLFEGAFVEAGLSFIIGHVNEVCFLSGPESPCATESIKELLIRLFFFLGFIKCLSPLAWAIIYGVLGILTPLLGFDDTSNSVFYDDDDSRKRRQRIQFFHLNPRIIGFRSTLRKDQSFIFKFTTKI